MATSGAWGAADSDLDELAQRRARVPSLILPFVIVGVVGGWLSGRVLAGPLVRVSSDHVPGWAALCCALTGAVAGALLSRQCRDEVAPTMCSWRRRIPMPVVVLLTGAVSGGLVAWGLPYGDDFWISAGLGALASLAFIPVSAYVVAAAKRAARARHGSLVAAADRRAVWGAVAATLSVATLASLPEWDPTYVRLSGAPLIAVAVASTGALAAAMLSLSDLLALWQLRRVMRARTEMKQRDADDPEPDASVPRVDLGLGANVHASTAQQSAYRHAARITKMIVGNFDEANDALRRAARRSACSALLLMAVWAIHYQALPNTELLLGSL